MKYILNFINILVYINSASNNTSSASVMLSCVIVHSVICEDENVLECVLYNFHTQRKQKDVVFPVLKIRLTV